jgi:hypothetical protein
VILAEAPQFSGWDITLAILLVLVAPVVTFGLAVAGCVFALRGGLRGPGREDVLLAAVIGVEVLAAIFVGAENGDPFVRLVAMIVLVQVGFLFLGAFEHLWRSSHPDEADG